MLLFPAHLERDDNGTFLITCPLLPEVTTFAEGELDWHERALDAIEEAIAERLNSWTDVPLPDGGDLYKDEDRTANRVVSLSLQTVMKLLLFQACKLSNVSRAELARRLSWHREQVDRLFRLDHASRIDQIDTAIKAVGKTFDINVTEAA